MQMAPSAFSCAACGWERPTGSTIQFLQGDLIDLDVSTKTAFQPRAGLRADCLGDPKAVWNAALAYCMSKGRKGEEGARKWAYGVWRGIYPGSKLPNGLFDAACRPAEVSSTEWSLIDREISRFRKTNKRRAAA